MRRQMFMLEKIMQALEWDEPINFPGYRPDLVHSHLLLLLEEGLVDGEAVEVMGGNSRFLALRLTWKGHDWLEERRKPAAPAPSPFAALRELNSHDPEVMAMKQARAKVKGQAYG